MDKKIKLLHRALDPCPFGRKGNGLKAGHMRFFWMGKDTLNTDLVAVAQELSIQSVECLEFGKARYLVMVQDDSKQVGLVPVHGRNRAASVFSGQLFLQHRDKSVEEHGDTSHEEQYHRKDPHYYSIHRRNNGIPGQPDVSMGRH